MLRELWRAAHQDEVLPEEGVLWGWLRLKPFGSGPRSDSSVIQHKNLENGYTFSCGHLRIVRVGAQILPCPVRMVFSCKSGHLSLCFGGKWEVV